MQKTNAEKTIGATVTGSNGLLTFQARKKAPLFTPPEGGKQGPPSAIPQMSHVALTRSPANKTLTEIDELSMTSILLDRFISGIENEAVLTVSIHVFYYLIQGDRGLDVPTLSQETGLSRNRVNGTIRALIATGKIKPLADNPNRFTLIRNGGTP